MSITGKKPAARRVRGAWARFLQSETRRREAVAEHRGRPGPRGWSTRGGGRASYIEPVPEFEAPTNQVCGLWPFPSGSGYPPIGVPLGRHLETAATVCADPISWFLSRMILNPSAFILGRPGLGKSSLLRHMCAVLPAWGVLPIFLSDTKGEHVDLVEALGGQVIPVGRGLGSINVLDLGPLVEHLVDLPEGKQRELLEDLRGRRQNMVAGLLELVMGRTLATVEYNVLAEGLRELDTREGTPVIKDLYDMIADGAERIRAVVRDRGDETFYFAKVNDLVDGLQALCAGGQFGAVFAGQTTHPIEVGRAVVFDMSTVEDSDIVLQAALQLVCWSYGSTTVQCAKVLSDEGVREAPMYLMVMDELWRVLRAASAMVDRIDALTRLNRQRGLGQVMVTHTMNDLKLDNDAATATAWGFVERSAMVFLGGLSANEMGNLETVFGMSDRERQLIEDWAPVAALSVEGGNEHPPGMGNFLLKTGTSPGIPFTVSLSPLEKDLNDTNRSWAGMTASRRGGSE